MGSYFLTVTNLGLGFYCIFSFLKFIIQFGLPYEPSRFLVYVVFLSLTSFLTLKVLVGFGLIYPQEYVFWTDLALISGSIGFLIQVVLLSLDVNLFLKKILSRIPLFGAIIISVLVPGIGRWIFLGSIFTIVFQLFVLVNTARYEKRILIKMVLFLCLFGLCFWINTYWSFVFGGLMLFPALFYFFIFEHSCGVNSLVQKKFAGEI
jgi:hypothetical protein